MVVLGLIDWCLIDSGLVATYLVESCCIGFGLVNLHLIGSGLVASCLVDLCGIG